LKFSFQLDTHSDGLRSRLALLFGFRSFEKTQAFLSRKIATSDAIEDVSSGRGIFHLGSLFGLSAQSCDDLFELAADSRIGYSKLLSHSLQTSSQEHEDPEEGGLVLRETAEIARMEMAPNLGLAVSTG